FSRHIESGKQLIIPFPALDVKQQCTAGIGRVSRVNAASGQLPYQPRIDRPKGKAPLGGKVSGAGNVIEQPAHLSPGKISIQHKTRPLLKDRRQPFSAHAITVFSGSAARPDYCIMNRFSGLASPDDGCFGVISYTDGGYIIRFYVAFT